MFSANMALFSRRPPPGPQLEMSATKDFIWLQRLGRPAAHNFNFCKLILFCVSLIRRCLAVQRRSSPKILMTSMRICAGLRVAGVCLKPNYKMPKRVIPIAIPMPRYNPRRRRARGLVHGKSKNLFTINHSVSHDEWDTQNLCRTHAGFAVNYN